MIVLFVGYIHAKEIVIVADRDEAKVLPNGKVWYPGMDGAKRLAKKLLQEVTSHVKIIRPPRHKDLRQWHNDGCTRDSILALVEGMRCENL